MNLLNIKSLIALDDDLGYVHELVRKGHNELVVAIAHGDAAQGLVAGAADAVLWCGVVATAGLIWVM